MGSIPAHNTGIVSLPVAKKPSLQWKNLPTRHQGYFIVFPFILGCHDRDMHADTGHSQHFPALQTETRQCGGNTVLVYPMYYGNYASITEE